MGYDEEGEWVEDEMEEQPEMNYNENTQSSNSLELAEKTLKESPVVSKLPEVLPETKISFLGDSAAKEIKHSAKNYDSLRYIKKILKLQKVEDDNIINCKKKIYLIRTKQDLKKYLKSINRGYLYNIIESEQEIENVIAVSHFIKPSGIAEDIQKITNDLAKVYTKYNEDNSLIKDIDDSGMLAKIAIESIVSSGTKGNERLALISTINATRNIDIKEQTRISQDGQSSMIGGLAKKAWRKFSK